MLFLFVGALVSHPVVMIFLINSTFSFCTEDHFYCCEDKTCKPEISLSLIITARVSIMLLLFSFLFKFHMTFSRGCYLVAAEETGVNFCKGLCSTQYDPL